MRAQFQVYTLAQEQERALKEYPVADLILLFAPDIDLLMSHQPEIEDLPPDLSRTRAWGTGRMRSSRGAA
jgi:hypothetical protein